MVKRFEDWSKRLSAFLTEHREKPFSYGENDCLQFAGKAVKALTGDDFLTQYPKYSTKEEADEIIASIGGIKNIIKYNLGNPSVKIMKAKRGDICLVRCPELTAGVIDDSGKFVVLVTEKGLIRKSFENIICFWSI